MSSSINFSSFFLKWSLSFWACSVFKKWIQRPLLVWTDRSILFMKLTFFRHVVSVAQANKKRCASQKLTSSTQHQPLFFPVNFSSSFWNQNIKKARTIDAAKIEIHLLLILGINKVPRVSNDSPTYLMSSFWNQNIKIARTIDAARPKIICLSLHRNTPSIDTRD